MDPDPGEERPLRPGIPDSESEQIDRMDNFDLFIVGGGPAGLMAAVSAAAAGCRVGVAEYLPSTGRKLLASGSGKCNLTNLLPPEEMAVRFTANPRRVLPALRAFPPEELRLWFRRRGVPTSPVDGFHCFPDSQKATDVLDALLREAARHGVRIFCGTAVEKLLISGGAVVGCRAGRREFSAGRMILAAGGNGYPALGARGLGYRLAESTGHTVRTPVPALVGLRTKEEWPARLAGITVERARAGFGRTRSRDGVLLFTKTGVSGPAVLDLAGEVNRALLTTRTATLTLRFETARTAEFWRTELERRRQSDGRKPIEALLAESFPRRLAETLAELAGCHGARLAGITAAARNRLCALLDAMPLEIIGSDGWEKAMATSGGVPLEEVNPRTLESRRISGLRFAGEMLDVGAPCGGYNLQWAFSSGRLAALA